MEMIKKIHHSEIQSKIFVSILLHCLDINSIAPEKIAFLVEQIQDLKQKEKASRLIKENELTLNRNSGIRSGYGFFD